MENKGNQNEASGSGYISSVSWCLYVVVAPDGMRTRLWNSNRVLRFQLARENSVGVFTVPSIWKKWQSEGEKTEKLIVFYAVLEKVALQSSLKSEFAKNNNVQIFVFILIKCISKSCKGQHKILPIRIFFNHNWHTLMMFLERIAYYNSNH